MGVNLLKNGTDWSADSYGSSAPTMYEPLPHVLAATRDKSRFTFDLPSYKLLCAFSNLFFLLTLGSHFNIYIIACQLKYRIPNEFPIFCQKTFNYLPSESYQRVVNGTSVPHSRPLD